jgi:hypothetical protein
MKSRFTLLQFAALSLALGTSLSSPAVIAQTDISASYNWDQLRMSGAGFVTGVAVQPTSPDLVYARTDLGGAYRWNESTRTWTQLITRTSVPDPRLGLASDYEIESIAVSRSNDQMVFVAAGNSADGRILRSVNRGQTWTTSAQRWNIVGNALDRTGGERLAVDPANDCIIYFGSRSQGLWVSRDTGDNWTQVPTSSIPLGRNLPANDPSGVKWVAFDPNSGVVNGATRRIYAGVAGSGIYRSDDAGATWQNILVAGSIPFDGKVAADGTLWVSFSAIESNGGLQRYTPASNSWANVAPAGNGTFWSFAIDPFNPQRAIAGWNGLNYGRTYRTLTTSQFAQSFQSGGSFQSLWRHSWIRRMPRLKKEVMALA